MKELNLLPGEHHMKRPKHDEQMFIPFDIMINILWRLPPISVARFRCVCKQWHIALCHPILLNVISGHNDLHGLKIINSQVQNKKMISYDFDSTGKLNRKDYDLSLPKLANTTFLSNFVHGLTCAYKQTSRSKVYLINPMTSDSICLPFPPASAPLAGKCCARPHRTICLGFDPSTQTYKIVSLFSGCTHRSCEILDVHIMNPKSRRWRLLEGKIPMEQTCRDIPPLLMHNTFHWKRRSFSDQAVHPLALITFDIKEEKFGWLNPADPPILSRTSSCFKGMKCLDGSLCQCFTDANTGHQLDVWVLRDYSKRLWTKRYVVDLSSMRKPLGSFLYSLVGIAGSQVILQMASHDRHWVIYCYDLLTKALRKLHEGPYQQLIVLYPKNSFE